MSTISSEQYLGSQYRDSSNLNARANLHVRFSTEKYPWFRWVFDHFDIPDEGRVLELGCGTGLLWRENLGRIPRGWDVTLSDASQGMVREAEQNLRHANLKFTFRTVDAQSIPYESRSFDAVIANHMLYHVADLSQALSEIRRVLKPRGCLYATTVGPSHMSELREVAPNLGIGESAGGHRQITQFNLEDGASDLAQWFVNVDVERRASALVVTEAEPLVEYVRSYTRLSDEEVARLRAHFDGEIRLKGAFRVTTESGIFLASVES